MSADVAYQGEIPTTHKIAFRLNASRDYWEWHDNFLKVEFIVWFPAISFSNLWNAEYEALSCDMECWSSTFYC